LGERISTRTYLEEVVGVELHYAFEGVAEMQIAGSMPPGSAHATCGRNVGVNAKMQGMEEWNIDSERERELGRRRREGAAGNSA
jgi:hypothetical protein